MSAEVTCICCWHGPVNSDESSLQHLELGFRVYLGGQGDYLVSRLITGINEITEGVVGVINLLTKSP